MTKSPMTAPSMEHLVCPFIHSSDEGCGPWDSPVSTVNWCGDVCNIESLKEEYSQNPGVKYISSSRDGDMFVLEMDDMVGNHGLGDVLLSADLVRESLDAFRQGMSRSTVRKYVITLQEMCDNIGIATTKRHVGYQ